MIKWLVVMIMNLLKMMYVVCVIYTFEDVDLRFIFSYIYMTVLLLSLMLSLHVETILILLFTFFDYTQLGLGILWHQAMVDSIEVPFAFVLLDHDLRQLIYRTLFTLEMTWFRSPYEWRNRSCWMWFCCHSCLPTLLLFRLHVYFHNFSLVLKVVYTRLFTFVICFQIFVANHSFQSVLS